MDVLIVGSIAYDSITSPVGSAPNTLGGSATYAGLAAAFHQRRLNLSSIGLVGVVGTDFRDEDFATLADAGLDTTGVEVVEGSTSIGLISITATWRKQRPMKLILTCLNPLSRGAFACASSKITFCANLHPFIQLSVLDRSTPQRASILDSMNLWINIALDEPVEAMKRVDIVVINDGEATMLAKTDNLVKRPKHVQSMASIPTLIIKKGEPGVLALHGDAFIALPAYPSDAVVDPTGCGDTFAGTLAACLASGDGEMSTKELREALVHATVSASFTLEDFGIKGIESISLDAYHDRLSRYCAITGTSIDSP